MDDLLSGEMEDLFQKLAQAQTQLDGIGGQLFEASAGGGLVKVTVNGHLELKKLSIDPKAIDPSDPGMLEDLILTAVNRSLQQARDGMRQAMMGGLGSGFPGL